MQGAPAKETVIDFENLVQSLQSPDCRVRKVAVLDASRRLVPPEQPRRHLEGLRRLVEDSRGDLHRQLSLILAKADAEVAFWEVRWRSFSFVEYLRGAHSPAEIGRRIGDARKMYLDTIKNPDESAVVRLYAAGEMLVAIDRFYQFSREKASPFPQDALGGWTADLLGLLRSRDHTVRLVGALAAGVRPGIPGTALRKDVVISKLISGLRHPEFVLRTRSQTTLEGLTGRDSCLDPTDIEAEREPEIKAWEIWWASQKGRIGAEKLSTK